jgi:peptide deformylase
MEKTSKISSKESSKASADPETSSKKDSVHGRVNARPVLTIVSEGHPALRQVADEVPLSEIKSAKIQDVIADMKLALAAQSDGIGLAAPQIGLPLRIFIVSKKIFSTHKANGEDIKPGSKTKVETDAETAAASKSAAAATKSAKTTESAAEENSSSESSSPAMDDLVFINPILVKESKEKKWMDGEGCLSVRWVYGKVKRSTKVTIRAFDQYGKAFERGAGGLLAHIFQHEVDHLNGVLFIDKAKDLEEVDQAEVKKAHAKEQKADKKAKTTAK